MDEYDAKEFKSVTVGGDVDAMLALARAYRRGEGAARDVSEAVDWYLEAADAGSSDAMADLAEMYRTGEGLARNLQKAVLWQGRSGRPESPDLLYDLACAHRAGEDGFARDSGKALELFVKAADAGRVGAMVKVGDMLCAGEGADKDVRKAMEWYRKAAEAGNTDAMGAIGFWIEKFGEESQDNVEVVKSWYRLATGIGDDDVKMMAVIGKRYFNGEGIFDKDPKSAMKWFLRALDSAGEDEKSAYSKSRDAEDVMYSIGYMHENGCGIPENDSKAIDWYSKAVISLNRMREYIVLSNLQKDKKRVINILGNVIGDRYFFGDRALFEKNHARALIWYGRAAECACTDAMYKIGYMYENGYGVDADETKAIEWYRKAARNLDWVLESNAIWHRKRNGYELHLNISDCKMMRIVGDKYRDGWEIFAKDKDRAESWYRKAEEAGRLESSDLFCDDEEGYDDDNDDG